MTKHIFAILLSIALMACSDEPKIQPETKQFLFERTGWPEIVLIHKNFISEIASIERLDKKMASDMTAINRKFDGADAPEIGRTCLTPIVQRTIRKIEDLTELFNKTETQLMLAIEAMFSKEQIARFNSTKSKEDFSSHYSLQARKIEDLMVVYFGTYRQEMMQYCSWEVRMLNANCKNIIGHSTMQKCQVLHYTPAESRQYKMIYKGVADIIKAVPVPHPLSR